MAVSTIDPTAALIVVDLQAGTAVLETPADLPDFAAVLANSVALAEAFRRRGLPVVLVTASGIAPGRSESGGARSSFPDGFDSVLPELGEADIRIDKQRWGAFVGTSLDDELRGRGVTQVVISGVATSLGVESTARSAHEYGYHVVLAVDAMTDRSAEAHRHSVGYVFPRLGETGTSAEILQLI